MKQTQNEDDTVVLVNDPQMAVLIHRSLMTYPVNEIQTNNNLPQFLGNNRLQVFTPLAYMQAVPDLRCLFIRPAHFRVEVQGS